MFLIASDPGIIDNFQGIRDKALLISALASVRNHYHYDGVNDPFELAALLIHAIERQQALVEGNKRLAAAVGIAFLSENGFDDAAERFIAQYDQVAEAVYQLASGFASPHELAATLRTVYHT